MAKEKLASIDEAIKICVIEENYNSKNYRGTMKNIEYYVIPYSNFREIKQSVSSIVPDVLLINENSDPYDLIQYFKKDYPVIMVVDKITIEKWREAIANGFNGITDKPVDYEKLRKILKEDTPDFADNGETSQVQAEYIDETTEKVPVSQPRPDIDRPASTTKETSQEISKVMPFKSNRSETKKNFGTGKVISYYNTKGGTGKTTYSINTAGYLSYLYPSKKILIIDFDIDNGDLAGFFNLENNINLLSWQHVPETTDTNVLADYIENYTIKHKSGISVLPAPTPPVNEGELTYKVAHRILNFSKQFFDYVIIDTGPNLRDSNVIMFENSSTIYLVTTDDYHSLRNVYDLVTTFQKLKLKDEKFKLILNGEVRGLEESEIKRFIPYEILLRVPHIKQVKNFTGSYELSYLQKRFNPYMQELIADITGKELPKISTFEKIKRLVR